MRRAMSMTILVSALLPLYGQPPTLLEGDRALRFTGESTPSGQVSVAVVPAPDSKEGVYSLQLRFRLNEYRERDWLDAAYIPVPNLDFSDSDGVRLRIRAGQPTDFLHLKLVDPQNPGANHAAYEQVLSHEGGPLPADQWVSLQIPLPAETDRRDGLTYVGFYISASDRRVPLDRDLLVHVGQFPYSVPERPAWPPPPRSETSAGTWRAVWSAPLRHDGPWVLVAGDDNQTDHVASFVNGGVEFHADAMGWNEFLWSDPDTLIIEPETTYRLQFDYEVLAALRGDPTATFYALVRARGTIREDVGWQRWQGTPGTQGRRLITFTTHDLPNYHLIMGIRHHGALRVENLRLWKVLEGEQP